MVSLRGQSINNVTAAVATIPAMMKTICSKDCNGCFSSNNSGKTERKKPRIDISIFHNLLNYLLLFLLLIY